MSEGAGQLPRKRVLVTGASGFLGSHLCALLHRLGARVIGVSRVERHEPAYVRWVKDDLLHHKQVERLFHEERPDLVYHLSGLASGITRLEMVEPTFQSLLATTKNVLLAAAHAGRPRIVLVGSLEEPQDVDEAPASPYAAAKFAATEYGRMFATLYEVPVVNVRAFMVYGPRQRRTKVIPYVINSLLAGEAPVLGSGRRALDWVYVEDVVEGLVAAATAERLGGATIDLGTGRLITIREAVETICRIIGPEIAPVFGGREDRAVETTRAADVETTARLIGWRARTPLEDGLARTVKWYREQMAGKGGAL